MSEFHRNSTRKFRACISVRPRELLFHAAGRPSRRPAFVHVLGSCVTGGRHLGGMSPHPHSPTRPHFCCRSQPLPDRSQKTLQDFSHRHRLPRGSSHPGRVPDRLRRCNSKWQQWLIPPSSVDRGSVPEGHPGGSGSSPSHTWWPALGVGGPCVCGTLGRLHGTSCQRTAPRALAPSWRHIYSQAPGVPAQVQHARNSDGAQAAASCPSPPVG